MKWNIEKSRFVRISGIITLILVFSWSLSFADDLYIGQKAPDLSGKLAVGKGLLKVSKLNKEFGFLKDKQGKFVEKDGKYVLQVTRNVVVLNFFATYCKPCIREIPAFNQIYEKYQNQPVKLLYVNVDAKINQTKAQRFILEKKIKPPMMLPNQKVAIKSYVANALPRIIVIDRQGKIARVITGFKDDLEQQLSQTIDELL